MHENHNSPEGRSPSSGPRLLLGRLLSVVSKDGESAAEGRRGFLIVYTTVVILLGGALLNQSAAQDYALTLYAGRMTNNNSSGSLSPSAKFVDTYIAAGGLSWVAKRIWNDALALEVEGVGAKYFGDQGNWEFDFSLAGRWKKFPWNETVSTTLAWGVGPSYATEIPKTEAANHHGTSKQWLVFWFGEVTVGPPKSKWAAVFRLHHRSPGYGLFGTTGGSNTPSLGLKFFF